MTREDHRAGDTHGADPDVRHDGQRLDAATEGARVDALRHLGWASVQRAFEAHLRSGLARDAARPLLDPEIGLEAARHRLAEQAGLERLLEIEANEASSERTRLRASLRDLEELGPTLELAARGVEVSVYELVAVADLARAAVVLDALLDRPAARGPELQALRARLGPAIEDTPGLASLVHRLDAAIERDREAPRVSGRASEALARARAVVRSRRQALIQRAERIVRRGELRERLADNYWTEREGRVVLPVRADALGGLRAAGAIIHGSSATGQTLFVEPGELVAENNALREAELEARAEERRVLLELSAEVGRHGARLRALQPVMVAIDELGARLELAAAMQAVAPTLIDPHEAGGPGLSLPEARHPGMVVEGVEAVVASDLVCLPGGALVISGPNAGGKTVALKTIGLCALMAAAGMRLPTAGPATVPVFRRLVTDVGDDQSIAANLSTFTAHMRHVDRALRSAASDGPGTLVLFDEIAAGTDPEQGAALAEAVLRRLVGLGATVVVTTHYERLKLLATEDAGARFGNAAVGFDLAAMRPTYRIHLGTPGASSAIAVARRLGLDEAVLAEAERRLGDEGLKVDVLLRQIADEKERLAGARHELEQAQARLEAQRVALASRERRLAEGARTRKARALDAAARELNQLEGDLKRKRRDLRRAARREELPGRAELVVPAERRLTQHSEPPGPAPVEEIAVGDRVRIVSLDQEGEVMELKGRGGARAVVQLPLMKTTVDRGDLRLLPRPGTTARRVRPGRAAPILARDAEWKATSQPEGHFGEDPRPVEAGIDNTVDLRGMRGDEACEALDRFLGEALGRDLDVVVVRHGHGSGALRKQLRAHLRGAAGVRQHRPGIAAEGGEAVTVVWVD